MTCKLRDRITFSYLIKNSDGYGGFNIRRAVGDMEMSGGNSSIKKEKY